MKTMGAGVPVILVLITGCWLYMLRTISVWFNKVPVPGRETDKWMLMLNSGIASLVIWLLLGGLLLLIGVKGVLPPKIGFASWFVLPVTGFLSLVALASMFDPTMRWAVIVPTSIPVLIAGYTLYLFVPSPPNYSTNVGLVVFGVAFVMAFFPLPKALMLAQAAGDNGSIEAKPGPEMDRWLAKEREKLRQSGLEEIHKIDEDTTINDLEHLTRGDSPVKAEAFEAMRHLPNRQSQAEKALMYEYTGILPLLPQIDIQPTPQLCAAAKEYLRKQIAFQKKQFTEPSDAMLAVLEDGLPGIGWMAKNCDCKPELELLDDLAKSQNQTLAIQKYREALSEMKK